MKIQLSSRDIAYTDLLPPALQGGEKLAQLTARFLDGELQAVFAVPGLQTGQVMLDDFFNGQVLREPAVLIAKRAVVHGGASVGLRAPIALARERCSAALAQRCLRAQKVVHRNAECVGYELKRIRAGYDLAALPA